MSVAAILHLHDAPHSAFIAVLPLLALHLLFASCCRLFPRLLLTRPQNYDTIGEALLASYEMLTGEGWPAIMPYYLDAAGYHKLPQTNAWPSVAIFYVVSILLLNALLAEIFSGVFAETFLHLREATSGVSLLTPAQRLWLDNVKAMLAASPSKYVQPPPPPSLDDLALLRGSGGVRSSSAGGASAGTGCSACCCSSRAGCGAFWRIAWARTRLLCHAVVMHPLFRHAITLLVAGNAVVLATVHYGQSASWEGVVTRFNIAFTVLFAIEPVLCIVGLGWRQYARWPSNLYALSLAALSVMFAGLRWHILSSLVRVLRIGRLLRLADRSSRLRSLLRSIGYAMPAFFSIIIFLAVIVFIFAVIGTNYLGGIRGTGTTTLGQGYSFDTIGTSIKALAAFVTGENYNGFMHDAASVFPPFCMPSTAFGLPIA